MNGSPSSPSRKTISNEQVARILLKHHGFVFRQARRFVLFTDLAEDVVQQVFVEILDKPEQWDPDKDLRPLLFVVTRRVAQRMWRKQARQMPDGLKEIAELMQRRLPEKEEDPDHDERITALQTCIQDLPPMGRKLIMDYYFEEISTKTLADRLRKKVNTIAQAICRLREKLRNCIEEKMGRSLD